MHETVRAWFDRRTFAADDFPPERLVRAKGGRTVSVVLPDETSSLLTRELLYTAITRARKRVRIIGTEAAVRAGVGRQVLRASGLRRTLLTES